MAVTNSQSYLDARYTYIKKYEGEFPYFYLDHSGYPTAGLGVLLLKNTVVYDKHIPAFRKNLSGDTQKTFNAIIDEINNSVEKTEPV